MKCSHQKLFMNEIKNINSCRNKGFNKYNSKVGKRPLTFKENAKQNPQYEEVFHCYKNKNKKNEISHIEPIKSATIPSIKKVSKNNNNYFLSEENLISLMNKYINYSLNKNQNNKKKKLIRNSLTHLNEEEKKENNIIEDKKKLYMESLIKKGILTEIKDMQKPKKETLKEKLTQKKKSFLEDIGIEPNDITSFQESNNENNNNNNNNKNQINQNINYNIQNNYINNNHFHYDANNNINDNYYKTFTGICSSNKKLKYFPSKNVDDLYLYEEESLSDKECKKAILKPKINQFEYIRKIKKERSKIQTNPNYLSVQPENPSKKVKFIKILTPKIDITLNDSFRHKNKKINKKINYTNYNGNRIQNFNNNKINLNKIKINTENNVGEEYILSHKKHFRSPEAFNKYIKNKKLKNKEIEEKKISKKNKELFIKFKNLYTLNYNCINDNYFKKYSPNYYNTISMKSKTHTSGFGLKDKRRENDEILMKNENFRDNNSTLIDANEYYLNILESKKLIIKNIYSKTETQFYNNKNSNKEKLKDIEEYFNKINKDNNNKNKLNNKDNLNNNNDKKEMIRKISKKINEALIKAKKIFSLEEINYENNNDENIKKDNIIKSDINKDKDKIVKDECIFEKNEKIIKNEDKQDNEQIKDIEKENDKQINEENIKILKIKEIKEDKENNPKKEDKIIEEIIKAQNKKNIILINSNNDEKKKYEENNKIKNINEIENDKDKKENINEKENEETKDFKENKEIKIIKENKNEEKLNNKKEKEKKNQDENNENEMNQKKEKGDNSYINGNIEKQKQKIEPNILKNFIEKLNHILKSNTFIILYKYYIKIAIFEHYFTSISYFIAFCKKYPFIKLREHFYKSKVLTSLKELINPFIKRHVHYFFDKLKESSPKKLNNIVNKSDENKKNSKLEENFLNILNKENKQIKENKENKENRENMENQNKKILLENELKTESLIDESSEDKKNSINSDFYNNGLNTINTGSIEKNKNDNKNSDLKIKDNNTNIYKNININDDTNDKKEKDISAERDKDNENIEEWVEIDSKNNKISPNEEPKKEKDNPNNNKSLKKNKDNNVMENIYTNIIINDDNILKDKNDILIIQNNIKIEKSRNEVVLNNEENKNSEKNNKLKDKIIELEKIDTDKLTEEIIEKILLSEISSKEAILIPKKKFKYEIKLKKNRSNLSANSANSTDNLMKDKDTFDLSGLSQLSLSDELASLNDSIMSSYTDKSFFNKTIIDKKKFRLLYFYQKYIAPQLIKLIRNEIIQKYDRIYKNISKPYANNSDKIMMSLILQDADMLRNNFKCQNNEETISNIIDRENILQKFEPINKKIRNLWKIKETKDKKDKNKEIPDYEEYLLYDDNLNRCLVDCCIELINCERKYGENGNPLIWSSRMREINFKYEKNNPNKLADFVCKNLYKFLKQKVGLICDNYEFMPGELINMEREKRLNNIIRNELDEGDYLWKNLEMEETQLKVEVSDIIMDQLYNEIIEILEHIQLNRNKAELYHNKSIYACEEMPKLSFQQTTTENVELDDNEEDNDLTNIVKT